jgi:hypothetical protein
MGNCVAVFILQSYGMGLEPGREWMGDMNLEHSKSNSENQSQQRLLWKSKFEFISPYSLWINENEFASSTSPPTPSPFDGEGELSEAQRG